MKKLILILSILAFVTSCQDKTSYKVVGKTNGLADGTKVYLCEDLFRKIIADSTTIKDNQFIFEGKLDKPVMCNLRIEGLSLKQEDVAEGVDINDMASVSTLFVLEPNTTIEIITIGDEGYFTVKGSTLTTKHINFWYTFPQRETSDSESVINMIIENKDNAIGIFYFSNIIEFLSPDSKTLKDLYPLFSDRRGENKKLDETLGYIEDIDSYIAIGTKYTDFKGKNLLEQEIAISDYVGKKDFVLLHFWSWIKNGMEDISYLSDAYIKYKDKNFEIIDISLEDNTKSWEEYINENNINWPHLNNKKSILDMIKAYALFDEPYTILIDKDGTIIDRNIPNTELDARLSKLLK